MLDVTPRTIRNWESGESRIPYSAFRLMRVYGGHSIVGEQWEGWNMWRGLLWTPEGRSFAPHELRYVANYLSMARIWIAEKQAASGGKNHLDLKATNGEAGSGSPASRVPLPQSGSGLRHAGLVGGFNASGLQEIIRSGNYSEIPSIDDSGKIAANDELELEVN